MKTIVIWLNSSEVSCWNFKEEHKNKIEKNMNDVRIILSSDKKAFLKALPEANIAFVWNFNQEWLESAPKLKLLVTPAAGKEFIQVSLPPDIAIEHSTFHGKIIGETVIGMILAHSRGILASYSLQKTEGWPRRKLDMQMRLLRGSRITILGFGNLGTWVGRLAKSFGARIFGIKRFTAPSPEYFDSEDKILTLNELDSVLPETDHLVLCLPVTDETTNLINKRRLNLLPSHAAVYNVGRGNSIDENALIEALYSKTIGAAYLDVFQNEPLPMDSPLRTCPDCFIMPHASGFAPDFMNFFVEEFLSRHGTSDQNPASL